MLINPLDRLDELTRLRGEAKVMRSLLAAALIVIGTIEPESSEECAALEELKDEIMDVLEAVQ